MNVARLTFLSYSIVLFVASLGCSGNVPVSGRVVFEDGSPLTVGQICFTNDEYMAKSDIDKNGEYSLHSLKKNDGIRKGTYKVYITGAIGFKESKESQGVSAYRFDSPIQLVDMQYTNPDLSGWVFDIQKKTKLDFVVYLPGEVPAEKRSDAAKKMLDDKK